MKWSIHEVRRRMVRIKTDASHFLRSGRGGVQGWSECRGIGGGGNSRFAGSAPSYPRFGRGLPTPRRTRPPVSCLFLWSWDIAQPSPPPKSMWVVDSYNATSAAVGIKLIVMLCAIRSIFSICNALCQGGLLTLPDVPPSVCYPSGRHWQRWGPKPGGQRNLDLRIGRERVSRRGDCQHQGGRGPAVRDRSTQVKC
jgi:hypothetical protein